MKRILFLTLLFSLPALVCGQSYIPTNFGLVLPFPEQYLKSEFSIRYNIRARQPNMPSGFLVAVWDSIEPGAYFSGIRMEGAMIPGFQGLKLVKLHLEGTDELVHSNSLQSIQLASHSTFSRTPQHFLLGIDAQKRIHYLSGNIFLDPVDHLLPAPLDMAVVAKIRIFYLSDDELQPIDAPEGHFRYEAPTSIVGRPLIIDLQDQNRFKIYPKGDENHPIAVVGGWARR